MEREAPSTKLKEGAINSADVNTYVEAKECILDVAIRAVVRVWDRTWGRRDQQPPNNSSFGFSPDTARFSQ